MDDRNCSRRLGDFSKILRKKKLFSIALFYVSPVICTPYRYFKTQEHPFEASYPF